MGERYAEDVEVLGSIPSPDMLFFVSFFDSPLNTLTLVFATSISNQLNQKLDQIFDLDNPCMYRPISILFQLLNSRQFNSKRFAAEGFVIRTNGFLIIVAEFSRKYTLKHEYNTANRYH